jgi:hypothetical protein
MRLGGILQPALARTTTAMATRRTAVAVRVQPAITRTVEVSNQAAAIASVMLLTPGSLIAFVFGMWRLGQDLGWTGNFIISQGLFSHWMVWMAISIGMKATATLSNRNGKSEESEIAVRQERR